MCIPQDDDGNDSKRPRLDKPSMNDDGGFSKWKRIKCPIDPTHTIYAHKLKKHLKICPKAKQLAKERSQVFYSENVNTGGVGSIHDPNMATKEMDKVEPPLPSLEFCSLDGY